MGTFSGIYLSLLSNHIPDISTPSIFPAFKIKFANLLQVHTANPLSYYFTGAAAAKISSISQQLQPQTENWRKT